MILYLSKLRHTTTTLCEDDDAEEGCAQRDDEYWSRPHTQRRYKEVDSLVLESKQFKHLLSTDTNRDWVSFWRDTSKVVCFPAFLPFLLPCLLLPLLDSFACFILDYRTYVKCFSLL